MLKTFVRRLWLQTEGIIDRKRTRLNSSHANNSYAVFCFKNNTTSLLRCANCGPVVRWWRFAPPRGMRHHASLVLESPGHVRSHVVGGMVVCVFFNDTATTEIYTLSLHDALPICVRQGAPEGQKNRFTGIHP